MFDPGSEVGPAQNVRASAPKARNDRAVNRSDVVQELAREAGFDLAGIAPLAPPKHAAEFERWLDRGHHAGMDWLERQRARIVDPRGLAPAGGSLLVVGLAHARAGVELEGGGRVARYAAGRDYHNVFQKRLRKLGRRLEREGLAGRWRAIADAGPLLERSHAETAGLGFASKAANLLSPRFGPWFFLGELVLDVELDATAAPASGSCGTCTACLDACPTEAIVAPGEVDSRRCISYQTIEQRGAIPRELRAETSTWAFGCDVCSEVCPWGGNVADFAERFGTHAGVAEHGLVEWLELGERFSEVLNGSALQRARREGLARNAALGLVRDGTERGRRALLKALTFDPAALVREAAAWSLARGYGDSEVRTAIERQASSEDDEAASELRRNLEEPLLPARDEA